MRLRDVPATIGWDGLALFVRHLPQGSALSRELDPQASWSAETHVLATISDQIGLLMYGLGGAKGAKPQPISRPGSSARYEGAEVVDINECIAGTEWKDVENGG